MDRPLTDAYSQEEGLLSEVVSERDWTGNGKEWRCVPVILSLTTSLKAYEIYVLASPSSVQETSER